MYFNIKNRNFVSLISLLGIMIISGNLFAQFNDNEDETVYRLDPVVVTGSRIPSLLSELGQSIEVISAEQLKEFPVNSLDEALKYLAGLDVRQRGVAGVQSDVSIRGSSFEQTLILIDGMAMTDPQSGHHNMNLPVNMADIERIEIVKSASSRVFGPNAMGGVINIITKKADDFAIHGYGKYGSYNFQNFGVAVPFKIWNTSQRFSFDHKKSDGYIGKNLNDFLTTTLRYGFQWEPFDGWKFDIGGGYTDRDFGAYKYYFESIPEQREKTNTWYGFANLAYDDQRFYLHQKSYYRKADDRFSYPVSPSAEVKNIHKTQVYGGQIDIGMMFPFGKTNIGINYGNEEIKSNALGDRDRYRFGYTLEHRIKFFKKLNLGVGITGLNYEDYGDDAWPGFDFSWNANKFVDIHGAVDKGFRMPSFTELYYSDPGNVGNSKLQPERIVNSELGIRTHFQGLQFNITTFYKDGKNILDWVKADDGKFYVQNFASVKFTGLEGRLEIFPNLDFLRIHLNHAFVNYTFLKSDLDAKGKDSKYILNNLKHQVNAGLSLNYFDHLYHFASIKMNQRVDEDFYTVIDTRIGLKYGLFDVYFELNNLLDVKYYEAGFAPMPGRWIALGMQINYGANE